MVDSTNLLFKGTRMLKFYISTFMAILLGIAVSTSVYAQPGIDSKQLPQKGVLSVSGGGGGQSYKIPEPWGSDDSVTGGTPPVAGSVSRISKTQWQAYVVNNSEDTYSIDFEVLQVDQNLALSKKDFGSFTLKPGQSNRQLFSAGIGSASASLRLTRWKNLTEKKKKAAEVTDEVIAEGSDEPEIRPPGPSAK